MRAWFRPDIIFRAPTSRQVMPWMVGLLVYLATLILGIALNTGTSAHQMEQVQKHSYTLLLDEHKEDAKVTSLLATLNLLPEVLKVTPVGADMLQEQLAPWLGDLSLSQQDVMLPMVIDVEVNPDQQSSFEGQITKLQEEKYPGLRMEAHASWVDSYTRILHSLQFLLLLLAGLMLVILSALVMLLTRTELGLQQRTVELLHTFGATRHYISRQCEFHMLRLGVKATLVALGLVTLTFGLFHLLSLPLGNVAATMLSIHLHHIPLILALGIITLGVIFYSARAASRRALRPLV